MDNLSPDFVRYWLGSDAGTSTLPSRGGEDDESNSASQSDALQALAQRIAAARSVL